MNICVFLGPTMPAEMAANILDAVYLPPAAQGDVYLAVRDGAQAIGIVDGYFQGAPSVWHKEILWAMSQGVHVFGSASMGALRAAELCVFGMQGVGRIFEAYRDGVITADDEVAVVHGPQELSYPSNTVPLVNIRETLARAAEQELITDHVHGILIDAARSLFYWDRSYPALLESSAASVDHDTLDVLSRWLDDNAVDQKRDDAIEMLKRMQALPEEPMRVVYCFQRTNAWQDLTEDVRLRIEPISRESRPESTDRVLNELRLAPGLYRQMQAASRSWNEDSITAAETSNPPISELQGSGHYQRLATRAADKHSVLNAQYGGLPEYGDAMLTPSEVLDWYFVDTCATAVPDDLDNYAKEFGIRSSGELCRILLHELLYEVARKSEQVNRAPI